MTVLHLISTALHDSFEVNKNVNKCLSEENCHIHEKCPGCDRAFAAFYGYKMT